MVRIITFQSAREGTGKSTIIANVATLLAANGQRVGVIDADLSTGNLHYLFGLRNTEIPHTFNDYLLGMCSALQTACDVTPQVETLRAHTLEKADSGKVFLLPASSNPQDFRRFLHQDYSVELITDGLLELAQQLALDVLLIDTQAGLKDEMLLTLLSMAIADTLTIILRLDHGDYQGSGVLLDVARTLGIPEIRLVVNQMASMIDPTHARTQVAQTYHCPVLAVLPHAEELAILGSADLFVCCYPAHPLTDHFRSMALALRLSGTTPPAGDHAH